MAPYASFPANTISYATAWIEAENIFKLYLTAQESTKVPVSSADRKKLRLPMTFETTDCITRGSKSEKRNYLCSQNSLQLSTKTLKVFWCQETVWRPTLTVLHLQRGWMRFCTDSYATQAWPPPPPPPWWQHQCIPNPQSSLRQYKYMEWNNWGTWSRHGGESVQTHGTRTQQETPGSRGLRREVQKCSDCKEALLSTGTKQAKGVLVQLL